MSGGVYGGGWSWSGGFLFSSFHDEVGAIVFDPGHFTFRAGYAGEEFPKSDLNSTMGVIEETSDQDKPKSSKYLIDPVTRCKPRDEMQMKGFLKNGLVEDWDMFESMLDYTYKRPLMGESKHHPVLMSEPPLSSKQKREQMTELFFEKFEVPAFFLCKTPVLAAFGNGRSCGLILDSGASATTATAVYDGYCIKQSVVKTDLAGDMLTDQCKRFFEAEGVDIIPSYLVQSKKPLKPNEPADWEKRSSLPKMTDSFMEQMKKEVLQDFQAAILQLSDTPFSAENLENVVGVQYEFPNGYTHEFIEQRLRISECLFDTSYLKGVNTSSVIPISQVAQTSIGLCDIEMRPSLYGNLIVTGGNTLIHGFSERLTHDLSGRCPANCRLKVQAAPTPQERRYGSWTGGSILASLGTFQQMWVSRQEYEESGKSIIDKKCP